MNAFRQCPSCGQARAAHELRCVCGALLAGVDLAWAPETASPRQDSSAPPISTISRQNEASPAAVAVSAAPAPPSICSYPDCAQPNPAGAVLCQYCNRPLVAGATLTWPWGEHVFIDSELLIGREAPAPQGLIDRLGAQFDNVSRRHALLRMLDGGLWIEDLASMNGTFMNGLRLAAHQPVRVPDGASLRFAAELIARVSLRPPLPSDNLPDKVDSPTA